ncbi:hypothetical protein GRS96_14990 [Rathayibacter sp. VKM Ac-2803]|uniref:hypothetical protein n=1 Tax=unclassified Rathayibacter TaxID=2609250 RepID=UPI00135C8515|nr:MULTISPECIES: hypothetical protein [unclassified Rathayibacter]MWV50577.1 hypothetical protein [Rathayibacter sp. VKM Ac-2803]MWV59578.1 hypothetical protein [Rathayibacter sp. VKM Ac-2754]
MVWSLIFGFFVVIATLAFTLWFLNRQGVFLAEIALPILVIASAMVLILALASAAIIFSRLDLANRNHAMGLPEGSIRAIIALLLLVIFAVVSVFLIANADRRDVRRIEGITQEQADQYPAQEVVSRTLLEEGSGLDEDGGRLVTVVLDGGDSPSLQMSQQLQTTLGTLVVAIAAFYFGSQAVQTATVKAKPTQRASDGEASPPRGPVAKTSSSADAESRGDPDPAMQPQPTGQRDDRRGEGVGATSREGTAADVAEGFAVDESNQTGETAREHNPPVRSDLAPAPSTAEENSDSGNTRLAW